MDSTTVSNKRSFSFHSLESLPPANKRVITTSKINATTTTYLDKYFLDKLLKNLEWKDSGLFIALGTQLKVCVEDSVCNTDEERSRYWDKKALEHVVHQYYGLEDSRQRHILQELSSIPLYYLFNAVTCYQMNQAKKDSSPFPPSKALLSKMGIKIFRNPNQNDTSSDSYDTDSIVKDSLRSSIIKYAFEMKEVYRAKYGESNCYNTTLVSNISQRLTVRSVLRLRLVSKSFFTWVERSSYWKVLRIGDYNFDSLRGGYINYRGRLKPFCAFLETTCLEEIVWEKTRNEERELLPYLLSLFSDDFRMKRLRSVRVDTSFPVYIKSWNPPTYTTIPDAIKRVPNVVAVLTTSKTLEDYSERANKIHQLLSNSDLSKDSEITDILNKYTTAICKEHRWTLSYRREYCIERQCIRCLELLVFHY